MNTIEYKAKSKELESLLKKLTEEGQLSKYEFKKLDDISDLIASFEEEKYPFKPDTLKEMIELRMYQRKLKQKDLAKILGTSPSRISEILNGKRSLTYELAKGLYSKLNIDPELILR